MFYEQRKEDKVGGVTDEEGQAQNDSEDILTLMNTRPSFGLLK